MALKPEGRIAIQLPARDFCREVMENLNSAISALDLSAKYIGMESSWHFPLKEELHGFIVDAGFVNIKVFYRNYTLL
jgi:hypothetical protein